MNQASAKNIFAKVQHALRIDELSPAARKILVGIVGGLVLIAGVAMIVLPGPAFVVIPLGLAILASEFCWARHYLKKARTWFDRARAKYSRKKKASEF
jgi:tellurite resistance protein TerC